MISPRNGRLGELLPLVLEVVSGLPVRTGEPGNQMVIRRRGEVGGVDTGVELGLETAACRGLAGLTRIDRKPRGGKVTVEVYLAGLGTEVVEPVDFGLAPKFRSRTVGGL